MGRPYYMCRSYRDARGNLAGVTAPLKEIFFPDYRHPAGRSGGGGWKAGSKVHNEMVYVVHLGRQLPRCPMAKLMVAHFAAVGLRPVAAETVVSIEGYGTAIDLEIEVLPGARRGYGPAGSRFLCEVKTGMAHCFTTPSGYMRAPLEMVPSSPYHHAALQLLVAHVMYRHTFPDRRLGAPPQVLLVNMVNGVVMLGMPSWVPGVGLNAAVAFLARRIGADTRPAKRRR